MSVRTFPEFLGEASMSYYGINRYLCDVFEDMRKCNKTLNFSPMEGLIEEAQILGSRMESALGDQRDLIKINEEYSQMRKKYKKLRKEIEQLEKKKESLKPKSKKKNK